MNYNDASRTPAELSLLQELNAYRRNGCEICLNGKPASPEKVAHACVREHCQYMRDFISDEAQTIQKINFIRIRDENEEGAHPGKQAYFTAPGRKRR